MSFDSWEVFREIQGERFERELRGRQARLERSLADAETDDERQALTESFKRGLESDLERLHHLTSWAPIYGAVGTALVWGIFWGISKLPIAWNELPQFLAHPALRLTAAAATAGLGYALFLLRKRNRFVYAVLELAVACATAHKSAYELAHSSAPDRWAYVLALMGSLYIAVRAFDNFDKWLHPEQEALRRTVEELVNAANASTKEPNVAAQRHALFPS